MNTNIYLIKDIARLSGLSIHTVKYYLKLALVKEEGRSPETNFRYFNDSTILRLKEIRRLRKDNISLRKIKEVLAAQA
jgi:DNA-binding transcriptional MerR regulator